MFDFLIENKQTLVAQKMNTIKFADGIGANIQADSTTTKTQVSKADTEIKVKAIINTTNILDSHKDVHLPNIWKKSLQENKRIMHLQEHQSNAFDKIIASGTDLKTYTETLTWKELGFKAEGTTQALVFESTVKKSRNAYMFEQYKNGFVDNHSVGMQYVKIAMAVNDKDYKEEKAVWDKYYDEIVNKEDADSVGYFFAVTEAKVIEGSAVPLGSNPITPTLEIKEPSKDTQQIEAETSLRNTENVKEFLKTIKI